jgi:hypothetical protein
MEQMQREHGSADGTLSLDDAPPEYRELNLQWQRLVAASTADWLNELGEPELARLAREEPTAFQDMIVSGQIMIGMGIDDPEEAFETAAQTEEDMTAGLALVAARRGTREAASIFRDVIASHWRTPDEVYALGTARFATMLWKEEHCDDDERLFMLNAIAEPVAFASSVESPEFALIRAELEPLEQRMQDGRPLESDRAIWLRLAREQKQIRERATARWLEGIDRTVSRLYADDPAEYQRRVEAGGRSLLGEFVEEAKLPMSDLI